MDIVTIAAFLGLTSLTWLINMTVRFDEVHSFFSSPLEESYDYIVVGAGSAGSVIALRLAENVNNSILVLEAGPKGNSLFDIPLITTLLLRSKIDWNHQTIPQKYACKALNNESSNWSMGKIVGGSSALNAMIYMRGHPSDFSEWYKDLPDFIYERDILPYFKSVEEYHGFFEKDDIFHGKSGPYHVETLKDQTLLQKLFLNAVNYLGFPVRDINAFYNTGFMATEVNNKFGKRWNTGHALKETKLPNLRVLTSSIVDKIIFEDASDFKRKNLWINLFKSNNLEDEQFKINLKDNNFQNVNSRDINFNDNSFMDYYYKNNFKTNNYETLNNFETLHSFQTSPTGSSLVAFGVTFSNSALNYKLQSRTIKANKGVILSAGAVGSAKILMLSGIGPKEHLKQMNIPPLIDLPVGDNLQDHIMTGIDLVITNRSFGFNTHEMMRPSSAFKYFIHGTGPWTVNGVEAVGVIDSENGECNSLILTQTCRNRKPDLEFMVFLSGLNADNGVHLREAWNVNNMFYDKYWEPIKNESSFSIMPVLLHPESKGTVRLRDNKPETPPIINPNYLSEINDIKTFVKGIRYAEQIIATPPMQMLGARLNDRHFPGCENYVFDSDEYWQCYVRHMTLTVFHPVGTCKMGSVLDETAVVDYGLKVKGTENLYVVDGSVLPSLPSANPNAAIIMMAEKFSRTLQNN